MSGFREAFTRGEKDNILGYDDTASLYFTGCILLCILIPWTFLFFTRRILRLRRNGGSLFGSSSSSKQRQSIRQCSCSTCVALRAAREASKSSWSKVINYCFITQLMILMILWFCFIRIAMKLNSTAVTIAVFDPYEILSISSFAGLKDIRKAYRTLSLRHHPDKVKNDPESAAKFILISKAYQALTDETARANYEKYGNPDGPSTLKIGIGLPHFMIAQEHRLFMLLFFFSILLVVIPGIFVIYYRKQRKFAPNGLMHETVRVVGYCLRDNSRQRQLAEITAASAESRENTKIRPSDNEAMKPVMAVIETQLNTKPLFPNSPPIIQRNYFLLLAHMQRRHELLNEALKNDLDTLLKSVDLITECMAELSFFHGWTFTLQAAIDLRRCFIQAVESSSPSLSLLQIPHFDKNILKHCLKGKHAVRDLKDFCLQAPEDRRGLTEMTEEQKADVSAFCSHVPIVSLSASAEVIGETGIVEGDVVTVTVKLTRINLKEGEVAGLVHAPYFPRAKQEEWWIYLSDKERKVFLTYEKSKNQKREFEVRLQFTSSRKGKATLCVEAYSDSYLGIDASTEININVLTVNEGKRQLFLHPDDEALDYQPTLFQAMMGVDGDEREESTDDEQEKDDKENMVE